MTPVVIVDTGPLVAFLSARDGWHAWAMEQLARLPPSLITCEAVLTETAFLLRGTRGGSDRLMELVERGMLTCPFELSAEAPHVRRLMKRYADVPMSLADACLVRMSEERPHSSVMTLDSDFRRYRKLGRQIIPLICPRAAARSRRSSA